MFNYIDGVMRASARKKTQLEEYLFIAVMFARQKVSKYYTEVTPMTGMLLILTHVFDSFIKLQSFTKQA
jgi:hypothetical protein